MIEFLKNLACTLACGVILIAFFWLDSYEKKERVHDR